MATVSLRREVKRGTRGPDAYAVKRLLKRKGFGRGLAMRGPWRFRFGPVAVRQLKRFQRRYGVRPDGVYGKATHRKALASNAIDRYGASLFRRVVVPKPGKISAVVSTALLGHRKRSQIFYTQSWLRMQGVKQRIRPPRVPRWEDCSSFATWCYWVAGAKDPNGLGYNGMGYTGTLARNGRRVDSPRAGDLIFYGGGWPYGHVAIYIGGGRVVSHGSSGGPYLLHWRYRPVSAIRRYL